MEERQKETFTPIVTFIILGLNILLFFIEVALHGENDTEIVLKMGGAYTPYILENGQWYRLITSMFLHFGINHIVGNSIALVAMGQYVEAYFGRIKFIIIYILSGICGNLLSMYMDLRNNSFPVSVGASGAICGLLGAMIIFAIDKRTRKTFPIPRIIFALIMVLLPGFRDSSIDAYAHIGGVIAGFIIALLMYLYQMKIFSD